MNYKNIYKQLIQKRLKQPANLIYQYTQNHHIIPKSYKPEMKNDKNNIVNLSAREHFIAHALLIKIAEQQNNKFLYYKMLCAFTMMKTHNKIEVTSKLYQKWRAQKNNFIIQSGLLKGENAYQFNKILISNKEIQKQKYITKDSIIPEGWKIGRLQKHKLRNYNGGRKKGSIGYTKGMVRIYNLQTNQGTYINKDQPLPNGWIYGMGPNSGNKTINHNNPTKGKKRIYNTTTLQRSLLEKDKPIPAGWAFGMGPK